MTKLTPKQLRFLFRAHPDWRSSSSPKVSVKPMSRFVYERQAHRFSANIGGSSANYRWPKFGSGR